MNLRAALLAPAGTTVPLLGNEALARGLLEGGLQLATAYPGTPSTEVMSSLMLIDACWSNITTNNNSNDDQPDDGALVVKASNNEVPAHGKLHTEWSVNEKVAAEVAIAGSMAGLRAATAMKGVGLNVASEPLQAYTYMRVRGGLVVIVADDPGLHSSHTEQDNRYLARQAHIPVLEPSSPQEAKQMAAAALELSELWGQPVMVRTTTRIGHTRGGVQLGELTHRPPVLEDGERGSFTHQPRRWVNLPVNARRMRQELIQRMSGIEAVAGELPFNRLEGPARAKEVMLACGAAYGPAREALRVLGLEERVALVKLGMTYPLPRQLIREVTGPADSILVVEELEPFVEQQVATLVNQSGLKARVWGKELLPLAGELDTELVIQALERWKMGIQGLVRTSPGPSPPSPGWSDQVRGLLKPRPPTLCAGCGHRAMFYAMSLVEMKVKRKGGSLMVKPSDIGCYTLGYNPPLNQVDAHLCMGGSLGMANGFAAVNRWVRGDHLEVAARAVATAPVMCTIGDSTFIHAGLPSLAQAATTGADLTVIILDNGTTAMTGHQPRVGKSNTLGGGKPTGGDRSTEVGQGLSAHSRIDLERLVRALGVEWVKVIMAEDLADNVKLMEQAVAYPGTAVLIAKSPCAILTMRELIAAGNPPAPYEVDQELCIDCGRCIDRLACPAIQRTLNDDGEPGKPRILAFQCSACGVCANELVCPVEAIGPGTREVGQ